MPQSTMFFCIFLLVSFASARHNVIVLDKEIDWVTINVPTLEQYEADLADPEHAILYGDDTYYSTEAFLKELDSSDYLIITGVNNTIYNTTGNNGTILAGYGNRILAITEEEDKEKPPTVSSHPLSWGRVIITDGTKPSRETLTKSVACLFVPREVADTIFNNTRKIPTVVTGIGAKLTAN